VLGTTVGEGIHVLRDAVGVDVGDQFQPHLLDHFGAETVHLLKLPARIDVQDRKRQLAREEGLARQVQHHGRILANGIEHHRVAELGCNLTDDMDAFRLQLFQMRQFVDHGYSRFSRWTAGGPLIGRNSNTALDSNQAAS